MKGDDDNGQIVRFPVAHLEIANHNKPLKLSDFHKVLNCRCTGPKQPFLKQPFRDTQIRQGKIKEDCTIFQSCFTCKYRSDRKTLDRQESTAKLQS